MLPSIVKDAVRFGISEYPHKIEARDLTQTPRGEVTCRHRQRAEGRAQQPRKAGQSQTQAVAPSGGSKEGHLLTP